MGVVLSKIQLRRLKISTLFGPSTTCACLEKDCRMKIEMTRIILATQPTSITPTIGLPILHLCASNIFLMAFPERMRSKHHWKRPSVPIYFAYDADYRQRKHASTQKSYSLTCKDLAALAFDLAALRTSHSACNVYKS